MRNLRIPALLLLVAGAGAVTLAARSPQGHGEGITPEMMAAMMELAQPGPEHEQLAKYAGEWDMEISMTMMPGMPAMTAQSTASAKMILGGRFLQVNTKGTFMGQSTETMSVLGFDRRHEQWTTVGFDTMGTYWVSGAGAEEEDGKVRLRGRDDDPMGEQVYYFEPNWISDDEYTWDVVFTQTAGTTYDPPHRMVSIRYTRKK